MKKILKQIIAKIFEKMKRIYNTENIKITTKKLSQVGINVKIPSNHLILGHRNIEIGNNVSLGMNIVMFATEAKIVIEDNVIFGPNVSIYTGNHNISVLGVPISEVREKLPSDDQPVNICEGVWIGAGSIILKGVTIGRDCVIGAGAIVTKSIEPYTIATGNPAHVVKRRFNAENELIHISESNKAKISKKE